MLIHRLRNVTPAVLLAVLLCQGCSSSGAQDDSSDEGRESVSQAEHDKRVDYVEFAATDLEKIKAFYSAVFGWSFTDWGPDYVSFADGRLNGGFAKADAVATGGPLVIIYAVDLEAVAADVKAHGGSIGKEIFEFPGGRRFHFADPSGNVLAVWSDQ